MNFIRKKQALWFTPKEYSKCEAVPDLGRTQPATTMEQAVKGVRTGRVELAIKEKRTANNSVLYYILLFLDRGLLFYTSSLIEVNTGSRGSDYCFEKIAVNTGREGDDKCFKLQNLENRDKRNMRLTLCQPQKKSPDVLHNYFKDKRAWWIIGRNSHESNSSTTKDKERRQNSYTSNSSNSCRNSTVSLHSQTRGKCAI